MRAQRCAHRALTAELGLVIGLWVWVGGQRNAGLFGSDDQDTGYDRSGGYDRTAGLMDNDAQDSDVDDDFDGDSDDTDYA